MKILKDCKDSDDVLSAFPMNTTNCSKYFGCPYFDFCTAWPNPLKRCNETPIGIEIEFWDPTREEVKTKITNGKVED